MFLFKLSVIYENNLVLGYFVLLFINILNGKNKSFCIRSLLIRVKR